MRKVQHCLTEKIGKVTGGRTIWNVRYADDTTIVANSKEEMEDIAEKLRQASEEMGLLINNTKTITMTIHGNGNVNINGQTISTVEKFKYLGSYIAQDGDSTADIKARFGQARSIAASLSEIWKSSDLNKQLKVQLAKTLVWSVALYGCETWTLRKAEERMINVFEMWLWRRVLRVSWTQRRTNEWVRRKIGIAEEKGMLNHVKERKLKKYGHWKRRGDSLVLATIEGEVCEKSKPGRRKTEWISNILDWRGGINRARRAAWEKNANGPP